MRDYQVTYRAVVESSDDFDEAREEFEAATVGEINEDGTMGFSLGLMDVQQMPRAGRSRTLEAHMDHIQAGITGYPPDAPPHPWDDGKWIFPDDHPLARLERTAHNEAMAAPPEDTARIKRATLELLPATEDDNEV